jgi:hypothetical protein
LVKAGIRQLLDAGYIYGAVIGQRMVTVDQKHRRREQRNAADHPQIRFRFEHYGRW